MLELAIVLVGLAQPLAAPPRSEHPVVVLSGNASRALHVLRIQMAAVCSSRAAVARGFTSDQSPTCRAINEGIDPLALHGVGLSWDGPSLLATAQAQLNHERASLRALEQRKSTTGTSGPQMKLQAQEAPRGVLQQLRGTAEGTR